MDYLFKLNNGLFIPSIGTGPGAPSPTTRWMWADNIPIFGRLINFLVLRINSRISQSKWVESVSESLKIGYRLIDYSSAYGYEQLLQKAIKKSGLKREELFIISRASNMDQYNNRIRDSFMESLKNIGIDYLDLYMFHWPVTDCYINTYKEIEKLYKDGLVKSIGVCNCHQHHLETIMQECEIIPMVNEIEVHPLFTQKPLIDFCKKHDIHVIAYTPLARNDDRLRKNPILQRIANKYNKNIYQIIIRWDIQNGITPIPRSKNSYRNRTNFDVYDFELTDDEIKAIDSININSRLRFDPDNLDFHSIG